MKLKLLRTRNRENLTTGQLYLNDEFFCFTLEDPVREKDGVPVEQWKIKGETAIPRGIYEVTFEDSPRFGPDTITINKVPGFTGVRIHGGNDPSDTEGCPLVGFRIDHRGIIIPGTSKPALLELKRRLRVSTDKITIQII